NENAIEEGSGEDRRVMPGGFEALARQRGVIEADEDEEDSETRDISAAEDRKWEATSSPSQQKSKMLRRRWDDSEGEEQGPGEEAEDDDVAVDDETRFAAEREEEGLESPTSSRRSKHKSRDKHRHSRHSERERDDDAS